MLNARRHRRGNQLPPPRRPKIATLGAQRPKASEGESVWDSYTRSRAGAVLNARRHRRGNQNPNAAYLIKNAMCSTPEGIGGGIRRSNSLEAAKIRPVLNARRHRRGNQGVPRRNFAVFWEVLNARRHRRGNQATGLRQLRQHQESAQRPKASEGESAVHIRSELANVGVLNARRHRRGNQQRELEKGKNVATVLNARRHRRGNQPPGQRSLRLISGAQRPKASEGESAESIGASKPASASAQRPKASEGESDPAHPLSAWLSPVLNARRHRRGNQKPYGGLPSATGILCSTPEGIGGGISLVVARPVDCRTVLNARRHRRGNQKLSQARKATPPKCSTPEGIGGGIRRRSLQPFQSGTGVLNARRHRRGNQFRGTVSVARILSSAQRPKASEGESDSRAVLSQNLERCSTPEGIGGGIRL